MFARSHRFDNFAIALAVAVFTAIPGVSAQQPDLKKLAHRIITTSVAVKPGEVVVISGGKHTIPFMEALAIEAQMAGGLVTVFLNSDSVARNYNMDVPEQYLSIEPRFWGEWLKQVDVFITLPNASDIKALDAGVSDARVGKMSRAGEFLTPMYDGMKFRELDIVYPTDARGASFGLDGPTYVNMLWSAMDVDYAQVAAKGGALRDMLRAAKSVRVTSPAGTDVTFAMAGRPITVDDGQITGAEAAGKPVASRTAAMPGGVVTVAPLETSANGKIVVPRVQCKYEVITGFSFAVKAGKMEIIAAKTGLPCYTGIMAQSSGPTDVFGSLTIGLNPSWSSHEEGGAAYYSNDGAGMVYLGFGDNQLLGGANKTAGNYGWGFPITQATVWIDGKKIVDGGKLMF